MDMRNSYSKKYFFKTRKKAEVDVEIVAYGHIVSQWQKQRKKKKWVSCNTALVIPSPCQWSSKSVPTEARVNWEI